MAFVLGIRLASCALAGATLFFTNETTKATKEKLRQWVAVKFTSRSSDPPSPNPNTCDAGRKAEGCDFVNGGTPADIHEPTLSPVKVMENAVKAVPIAEGDNTVNGEPPAHLEEPTLAAVKVTENAVEGDSTVEQTKPNQHNAVNGDLTVKRLQRQGVNPIHEIPAVVVVEADSLEATGVDRTVDDVDKAVRVDRSCQTELDKLARDAPDPDLPPGQGIRGSFAAAAVDAVKEWAGSLFNRLTTIMGYVLDPKRYKMRRILIRIGSRVVDFMIHDHPSMRHKVWRTIYIILKTEFWNAWCL